MSTSRFAPFVDALRSKYNAIMICIGLLFFLDMLCSGPFVSAIIRAQASIFKVDITAKNFELYTIFGTFNDIKKLAMLIDKTIGFICIGVGLLGYFLGFIASISRKKEKDEIQIPDREKL